MEKTVKSENTANDYLDYNEDCIEEEPLDVKVEKEDCHAISAEKDILETMDSTSKKFCWDLDYLKINLIKAEAVKDSQVLEKSCEFDALDSNVTLKSNFDDISEDDRSENALSSDAGKNGKCRSLHDKFSETRKRFSCPKCDYSSRFSSNLNNHKRKHHNEFKGDPVIQRKKLRETKIHTTSLDNGSNSFIHHTVEGHEWEHNTKEIRHKCIHCGDSFLDLKLLRYHEEHSKCKTNRGLEVKSILYENRKEPHSKDKENTSVCDEKVSQSTEDYKRNRRSEPRERVYKVYKCKMCKYSTKQKHNLDEHKNFHTGERPYTCLKCNFSFKYHRNLLCHLKVCPITKNRGVKSKNREENKFTSDDTSSNLSHNNNVKDDHNLRRKSNQQKDDICVVNLKRKQHLRFGVAHNFNLEQNGNEKVEDILDSEKNSDSQDLNCNITEGDEEETQKDKPEGTILKLHSDGDESMSEKESNTVTINLSSFRKESEDTSKEICNSHETNDLNSTELLRCSACGFIAQTTTQMNLHQSLHTGSKPYICLKCNYGTHKRTHYFRHKRTKKCFNNHKLEKKEEQVMESTSRDHSSSDETESNARVGASNETSSGHKRTLRERKINRKRAQVAIDSDKELIEDKELYLDKVNLNQNIAENDDESLYNSLSPDTSNKSFSNNSNVELDDDVFSNYTSSEDENSKGSGSKRKRSLRIMKLRKCQKERDADSDESEFSYDDELNLQSKRRFSKRINKKKFSNLNEDIGIFSESLESDDNSVSSNPSYVKVGTSHQNSNNNNNTESNEDNSDSEIFNNSSSSDVNLDMNKSIEMNNEAELFKFFPADSENDYGDEALIQIFFQKPEVVLEKLKLHICSTCDFVSHLSSKLETHKSETHLRSKKYKCSGCSFTSVVLRDLKRHEETHKKNVGEESMSSDFENELTVIEKIGKSENELRMESMSSDSENELTIIGKTEKSNPGDGACKKSKNELRMKNMSSDSDNELTVIQKIEKSNPGDDACKKSKNELRMKNMSSDSDNELTVIQKIEKSNPGDGACKKSKNELRMKNMSSDSDNELTVIQKIEKSNPGDGACKKSKNELRMKNMSSDSDNELTVIQKIEKSNRGDDACNKSKNDLHLDSNASFLNGNNDDGNKDSLRNLPTNLNNGGDVLSQDFCGVDLDCQLAINNDDSKENVGKVDLSYVHDTICRVVNNKIASMFRNILGIEFDQKLLEESTSESSVKLLKSDQKFVDSVLKNCVNDFSTKHSQNDLKVKNVDRTLIDNINKTVELYKETLNDSDEVALESNKPNTRTDENSHNDCLNNLERSKNVSQEVISEILKYFECKSINDDNENSIEKYKDATSQIRVKELSSNLNLDCTSINSSEHVNENDVDPYSKSESLVESNPSKGDTHSLRANVEFNSKDLSKRKLHRKSFFCSHSPRKRKNENYVKEKEFYEPIVFNIVDKDSEPGDDVMIIDETKTISSKPFHSEFNNINLPILHPIHSNEISSFELSPVVETISENHKILNIHKPLHRNDDNSMNKSNTNICEDNLMSNNFTNTQELSTHLSYSSNASEFTSLNSGSNTGLILVPGNLNINFSVSPSPVIYSNRELTVRPLSFPTTSGITEDTKKLHLTVPESLKSQYPLTNLISPSHVNKLSGSENVIKMGDNIPAYHLKKNPKESVQPVVSEVIIPNSEYSPQEYIVYPQQKTTYETKPITSEEISKHSTLNNSPIINTTGQSSALKGLYPQEGCSSKVPPKEIGSDNVPGIDAVKTKVPFDECKAKNSSSLGGGFIFRCNKCTYVTNVKHYFSRHYVNMHVKKKIFKCNYCTYVTNVKADISHHYVNEHGEKNIFRCDKCDYVTNVKHYFSRHYVAVHVREKRFKCDLCDYAAYHRYEVARHSVVHSQVKKFHCKICPYKAKGKRTLQAHLSSHQNRS